MSGSQQTTSKVDPWIPSQETFDHFRNMGAGLITDRFRQGLNAGGQTLTDAKQNIGTNPKFTQAMTQAISGAGQLDGQFDQATTAAQTPQYAPGFRGTMAAMQDPNARSAAFAQVKQNVADDVMKGVNATFANSGMTGSSLHQANLAKGLTAGLANVENQAFQQGQNRAMQAAQIGQNDLRAQISTGLGAAGARQNALNAGQGRAMQAANALNNAQGQQFARTLGLSQAQAGLGQQYQSAYQGGVQGLMSAATGNATRTTTQQNNPGLLGILGAGLQVASLFSDERLKEDVKRVGKMDDGTPIYTYRYKDGVAPEFEGKTLMGVMAQKVKKSGAVETDPSGFKRVNYGAL